MKHCVVVEIINPREINLKRNIVTLTSSISNNQRT